MKKKIMRKKMKKYITTPIYYVNDKPHLGSAYTTIACDVWARFQRFMNEDVFFLTGTDEHGLKIQQAAEKAGKEPKEFVDQVSICFEDMMQHLHISHDDFIRTTQKRHKIAAQHLWQTLYDKGYIYLGEYSGWYAVRDETYYKAEELIDGKAPTGADVTWVSESSYFFKLSAFGDILLKHIEDHPDFIQPQSKRNEVISFIKSGLQDLSISRSSFKWGIPLPHGCTNANTEHHVMYVWIDALTNYITALGYPNNFDAERFAQAIHVVGKDILRFHTVYWPAMLIAADLPLPKQIFAHGWWTVEGEKMSKSLGNTVDPIALSEQYGVDAVRNFVLREMPFGNDGNFAATAFTARTNADLANAYGNLAQRVLSFIQKNTQGCIPQPSTFIDADTQLMNMIPQRMDKLKDHMESLQFHKYAEDLWHVISECNIYVDQQKPWELNKTDVARMNTVLYTLCETIRKITLLTQCLLPVGTDKILDYLAIPKAERTVSFLNQHLVPGTHLPQPQGVYPRF